MHISVYDIYIYICIHKCVCVCIYIGIQNNIRFCVQLCGSCLRGSPCACERMRWGRCLRGVGLGAAPTVHERAAAGSAMQRAPVN